MKAPVERETPRTLGGRWYLAARVNVDDSPFYLYIGGYSENFSLFPPASALEKGHADAEVLSSA